MRLRRATRELAMALVLPGVTVALLWSASQLDLRFALRQNPFHAPRDLAACKSNLRNVGTALEMYSTDASGRYPRTLAPLVPNYLKTMPTCPSRGADTYSGGYSRAENPDWYTVHCHGSNHPYMEVGRNQPEYSSVQGLIEK